MAHDRTLALAEYASPRFTPEPEGWTARRAFGESLRPGLQMSAYEGAMVAWLLRLHGARRVVEIGSFVGVSALWLASALPEDGKLTTLERDAAYAAHARETLALAGEKRAGIVEGDALAYLQQSTETFDAVFIDGEKRTYPDMLEAALPKLRAGALIIADNTLLFGAVLGTVPAARVSAAALAAMERFHTILADKARFDTIILPTTEGLTVALYRPDAQR